MIIRYLKITNNESQEEKKKINQAKTVTVVLFFSWPALIVGVTILTTRC